MRLFLKNLVFLIFVQGTAVIFIPLYIVERQPFSLDAFRWIGIIPLLAGAVIIIWCDWDFWKNGRGTPAIIDAPKFLVKRGLYRFVRNPMYIGVLLVITGEAILFASWAIAMYALTAAILLHMFVLLSEEPTLRDRFGVTYEEYLRTVPRWIPRLKKKL